MSKIGRFRIILEICPKTSNNTRNWRNVRGYNSGPRNSEKSKNHENHLKHVQICIGTHSIHFGDEEC